MVVSWLATHFLGAPAPFCCHLHGGSEHSLGFEGHRGMSQWDQQLLSPALAPQIWMAMISCPTGQPWGNVKQLPAPCRPGAPRGTWAWIPARMLPTTTNQTWPSPAGMRPPWAGHSDRGRVGSPPQGCTAGIPKREVQGAARPLLRDCQHPQPKLSAPSVCPTALLPRAQGCLCSNSGNSWPVL